MTITTGAGKKFMEELPLGIHTLAEGTPSDTIKVAVYGPNATLSPVMETYTTDGEVVGAGYTAGGVTLTDGLIVVGRSGSSRNGGQQFIEGAYIQPVSDTQIAVANVAVRGLLMYNATQGNRLIFTLDLGDTVSPSVGLLMRWGVADVVSFEDTLIPLIGKQF
jgi:hypothetical protein